MKLLQEVNDLINESTWGNRFLHWCKVNEKDPKSRTAFQKFVNNHKRIALDVKAALEKELGLISEDETTQK